MSALIELLARQGWTVAAGYSPRNVAVCRRCTHQVLWCSYDGGRRAPMNRDGSRHPAQCRVDIRSVRRAETGTEPLRHCGYCSKATRYSPADLRLHITAKHPIARILPRSIDKGP